MIPAVITQLDTLPETVNGKVDRKALPDVEPTASVHEMKAPHNDMERQLRDAFAEVLHMDQEEISITDDFFELGGDSLKSMMLLSRLQPLNIMSSDIFSLRTIERIAAMLQEKKQGKSLDEIEEQECKRLSICKAIIDRCQGDIGVDSEGEGHGSTFWFWIPQ